MYGSMLCVMETWVVHVLLAKKWTEALFQKKIQQVSLQTTELL